MNVKIFGVLIVACAFLFTASPVSAQCGVVRHGPVFSSCNNYSCNPVVIETPVVSTVVAPIAVPVFVPAFQFQYVPPTAIPVPAGYPGQTVPGLGSGGLPVAVPGQPGYAQPVAPYGQPGYAQPGYGSTPPAYGQPAVGYGQPAVPQGAPQAPVSDKDNIRELAKALLAEMSRQSVQSGDTGPPAVPNTAPTGVSPPVGVAPPTGTVGTPGVPPGLPTGPVVSPAAAAPLAIAALQSKCSACHTGPASKGEFVMFSQPGLFNQGIPWRTIVREIDSGRMPPNYSQYRISPQEAAAIRAWLTGI